MAFIVKALKCDFSQNVQTRLRVSTACCCWKAESTKNNLAKHTACWKMLQLMQYYQCECVRGGWPTGFNKTLWVFPEMVLLLFFYGKTGERSRTDPSMIWVLVVDYMKIMGKWEGAPPSKGLCTEFRISNISCWQKQSQLWLSIRHNWWEWLECC